MLKLSNEVEEFKEPTKWWIWGIVMVIVAVTALTSMSRVWQNMETSRTRQTLQYRASAETMLIDTMVKYNKLDTDALKWGTDPQNAKVVEGIRTQQAALLLQMRKEAKRLSRNQVPEEVRDFLLAHSQ